MLYDYDIQSMGAYLWCARVQLAAAHHQALQQPLQQLLPWLLPKCSECPQQHGGISACKAVLLLAC
jgi:hypothetical protein